MRGSHDIFKKVAGSTENIFKKVSGAGKDIFKKAPEALEKVSSGAGQAQNVLERVSKISGKIASSPITKSLPFGSSIAGGASAISGLSKVGAKGAGQIAELSDVSKYKKGGVQKQLENIGDIQRRGREIEKTGRELGNVFV